MAGEGNTSFVGATFDGPEGPRILVVNETAGFVDIGDEAAPPFVEGTVSADILRGVDEAVADVEGVAYGLPEGLGSKTKIGHNHGGPEEGHRADDGNGGLFSRSRHGKKPAFGEVVGLGAPLSEDAELTVVDGFPIPDEQRRAHSRYRSGGGATGPSYPAA